MYTNKLDYKNLRVLMIGPKPPDVGGIASYVKDLSDILSSEFKVNVDILSPYVVKKGERWAYVKKAKSIIKNIFSLVLYTYNKKYDLVHIHTSSKFSFYENSLYIVISKFLSRKPIVLHNHAPDFDLFLQKSSTPAIRYIEKIMNVCDIVVVISEHWKNVLAEEINLNCCISIIEDSVNEKYFLTTDKDTSRAILSLPQNKQIIFSVGNLVERKGFNFLIEAMSFVCKKQNDICLFIGGSGPQQNNLQKLIEELKLENFVKLIGFVPDELIYHWMNSCDIFAMPSLKESFGLVQVEAMACGKPVVATYNGGSESVVINDDYGLLCQPGNSVELANIIIYTFSKQWNSLKIKEYAQTYKWDSSINKILDVYSKVLNNTKPPSKSAI